MPRVHKAAVAYWNTCKIKQEVGIVKDVSACNYLNMFCCI